ncbi:glycosyltransferase involved in cell wall biosynthesis [Neobacillus bataviensis]|uniref:Glycosyltransferase involved in cell wall biosynthesis n=1 Tax=Neobacillus bataviensis TaxID=220685 RepID=A0A561CMA5_9BACI|nr:glycosyltransferase family 4 protein [Neobacillus bataviensis]TWD92379.1 glycosyltransferase involved in cell wall biosynthesis [Neobacillus bataviensis]
MNVLSVNKFYHIKGGSETYLFALEDELKKRKHNVFPFSMKDDNNKEAITSEYFVDNINYSNASFFEKVSHSTKIVYSREAQKKMDLLLKEYSIDIAHLNLFQHQLSPSILYPIKKRNIPVVYTVHDLKVLCPNYKMLTNGSVCEKCKGGKYYNAVLNKCTKDSLLGSTVNMIESYVHASLGIYKNFIDMFITPSNFYREKMIEWGFPAEKIVHIPNFVDPNQFTPSWEYEDYFLYIGRLSEEKGIFTLLQAVNETQTNTKVKIAGTGPLQEELEKFIQQNNLSSKVELLGFQSGSNLEQLVKNSKAVIMPSEWYENGPLALIESFAYGKLVIGSDIGGIPEHIDKGQNGFLFTPKNYNELASIMNKVNTFENSKLKTMGISARKKVEDIYNNDYYMDKLLKIYDTVTKAQNKVVN